MQDIIHQPTAVPGSEAPAPQEATEFLKDEAPLAEAPSPVPLRASRPLHPATMSSFSLPERGLSYALIAGAIAGVLSAVLTILIVLVNTATFHAARLQIAVDRLTVKTALALAGWEVFTFVLSLLIGFFVGCIVGRIAVRRRHGFLAGALAGAISFLLIFLVSLLPGYPGNLVVNDTTMTPGSLVIPFLLLCLWGLGGGLVSLFGTWITTVRHPYYLRQGA